MAIPTAAVRDSAHAADPQGVYARLLGDAFARVPEPLRSFHSAPSGVTAAGTLEVRRGTGRLARLIASVLGLPADSADAVVVLTITIEGPKQKWERRFDGRRLVSWQQAHGALLLERFGPYTFGLRLQCEDDGLSYTFVRAWFLGIPVPSWLAVESTARTRAQGIGWFLESEVTAPLVGLLVRYTGTVTPT